MAIPDRPKIVYQDPVCMVATWRALVIPVIGKAKFPAESARAQIRAIEAHGKQIGKRKVVEITLLDRELSLPDGETRAVLDTGVPILGPYYGVVSAVFEGDGFRAAFVRGLLTSFQMMSGSEYPQKVFPSVEDAAKWTFGQALPLGFIVANPGEIAEAVSIVRNLAIERGVLSMAAANIATT